ncbi:MAG: tetratricopeptide repeat protein [Bacteroidia bacterium]|nr:tetratricopeptide repeat protein [Bacteroidia bacterium]
MPERITKVLKENAILCLVLLTGLLVYSRFLFYSHISWDDPEMLFRNKDVRDFDLKAIFTNHYVGNYIPITMLFHSLAWFLFGNADWGHHLLNILLHTINAFLVYRLGKKLFKSETISLTGCIVFFIHPLQIESVGWISELKNVLSTTFSLAGLIWYLNYLEKKSQQNYLITFLFFSLACLSKPSAVTFPLSLVCLDVIVQQKISFRFLLNKIPFLILSIVFGLVNIKTQSADQFINHAHEFPWYQRFGFSGYALMKYFILFLAPVNLSVIYPYPDVKWSVFIVGFIILLSVVFLLLLFRKKNQTLFALLLFVLFNLILVLQFLPFGEVLYADRYFYVPVIGLAWMIGIFGEKLSLRPIILYLVLLLYFSVLSFARTGTWKSAMSLYEDIIKKYPDQFVALNSAGVESMFLNEDEKALGYLNKAVSVAPKNYKGYYNRGLLYLKNGKTEDAIKSFNQSLAIYPYSKAYAARAAAYYSAGDLPKAMNDANYVLQREPENAKAHFVLANCYNDLNKLDEALKEYNRCITINGEEADFYFKRAIVFGKKQDFKSCLDDLDLCIYFRGDYYEAYYWRGVAKVNLNQNPCEDLIVAARNNFDPAVKAYHKYCK